MDKMKMVIEADYNENKEMYEVKIASQETGTSLNGEETTIHREGIIELEPLCEDVIIPLAVLIFNGYEGLDVRGVKYNYSIDIE